jgi:dolichol-phosphate mannosyltransferase
MGERPLVSIVIPAYNEALCLGKLHSELNAVCDRLPYSFEFIFVNDGSTDPTDDVLAGLRKSNERVRYLTLSRNFGHQAALSAGLAHAAGDAVIMMDGDLQHPPGLIPRLLESWESGFDVVNTVRLDTAGSSPSKTLFSRLFYSVFRLLTGCRLEPGSADFRLMARRPVDAFIALPERHRFVRGLVPWLGFRQTKVEFHAPARWAGQPKYTFARSMRLALEGVTSFNVYPLRLIAVLGVIVMAASLAHGVVVCFQDRTGALQQRSSSPFVGGLYFLGGLQLVALAVISEYIGRTLDQVRGRPLYIVRSACGFADFDRPAPALIPPPHLFASPPRSKVAASAAKMSEVDSRER